MDTLTEHGRTLCALLSERYGLSNDAALSMMMAVHNGGGTQAQFSHPELGGMGQWSSGGMTMVGDMFNSGLQALVANICSDISNAYFQGAFYPPRRDPAQTGQQQSQGGASLHLQGGSFGPWWPEEFGQPSSSGAQNNLRYAIFPDARRLAIDLNGVLTVYDTGAHLISGVGQQQSGDASWTFTSQFGTVYLNQLPIVGEEAPQIPVPPEMHAVPDLEPDAMPEPAPSVQPAPSPAQNVVASAEDVLDTLERLGALHEKGIVTADEFAAKKAELLARL